MAENWSATLVVLTSTIGTVLGWIGGCIKNKIANKKDSADASAVLSDYYKREIEYITEKSESHLNKIKELEGAVDRAMDYSCSVDKCTKRRPLVYKKVFNYETNTKKNL